MMLLAAGISGATNLIGGLFQNKQAKDIKEEGDYYKQYGMRNMEQSILQRQQAYNNIWKMVYGGVGNFDFNTMLDNNISMTRDPNLIYDSEGHIIDNKGISSGRGRSGLSNPSAGEEKAIQEDVGKHSRRTSVTGK